MLNSILVNSGIVVISAFILLSVLFMLRAATPGEARGYSYFFLFAAVVSAILFLVAVALSRLS